MLGVFKSENNVEKKAKQNKVDNLRIVLLINERKSRLCSFFNVAFYFCLFSTNQSQSFRSVNFVSRLVSHRFPKKRWKNLFVLFAFLLFTANQIRPFVFWENLWRTILLFKIKWPLSNTLNFSKNHILFYMSLHIWDFLFIRFLPVLLIFKKKFPSGLLFETSVVFKTLWEQIYQTH